MASTPQRITQADIDAASRGLGMAARTVADLHVLAERHNLNELFASRCIAAAAEQMIAAKSRAGSTVTGAE
jgi:hypothetical protein